MVAGDRFPVLDDIRNENVTPNDALSAYYLRFFMHKAKDFLHKSGYYVGRYVSMEQRINDDKETYYLAFAKSSEKWTTGKNDYMPFIEFFLRMLSESYTELASRIPLAADRKQGKADRITALVTRSLVALSKRDICERLPDVSQTTVEATLAKLLKEGRIRKLGQGRSTRYIRAVEE